MKHPLPLIFLLFSLFLPAAPLQAADDVIEKTYCTQGIAYDTIDDLKLHLLNNAKKAVIDELFGEFIVASTAVENFVVTKDQIQTSSLGFVRVEGNTKFHNGEDFADVCVTIAGYVTAEDRAKFVPEPLDNKYCDADDDMTTSQLIAYVKDETIIQALIEYNPKLKDADKDSLLQLVQKVTYLENGFISDTQTYCASFEGEVIPVEVMAFLEEKSTESMTNSTLDSIGEDIPVEGLVAYYRFDEGNGTTTADATENGNDGTLNAGMDWNVDTLSGNGYALNFDGVDDMLIVDDNDTLDLKHLTISLWIKPTQQKGEWQPILTKETDNSLARNYGLYIHPNSLLLHFHAHREDCGNNSWLGHVDSVKQMTLKVWNHVAITFDGNVAILYLNGREEARRSYNNVGLCQNDYPLRIGNQVSIYAGFSGSIDDVLIYDQAVSTDTIKALATLRE